MEKSSRIKSKYKTIKWSFKVAWEIDKKMMLLWFILSILIAALPSIVLLYKQEVLRLLTEFLQYNNVDMRDIYKYIFIVGFIMTLQGLSTRINGDLIYMVMYDSYYLGMQELLMNHINKIHLDDLLKKEVNDEYNAAFVRAGSLTNFMSSFCTLSGKIVSILMLLIVAFKYSKVVFLISLIYTIGVIYFNSYFVEKLRWSNEKYQAVERLSSYYEKMPTNLGIAKEIRVFDLEDEILTKWRRSFKELKDFEQKRSFNMELRNLVSSIAFCLFIIIMISYSITLVANHTLSVDICLVIYMLCINLFSSISGLAKVYMETDYGLFALEKQYSFIYNSPVSEDKGECKTTDVSESDVVFEGKDLTFCYGNNKKAIDNINFKIKKGEIVALVGLNGSGKTTFTKLLLGLYRPTSGQLLFQGKPYEKYKKGEIGNRIGSFFQDTYLFHTPLSENIAYGKIQYKDDESKILNAINKGGAKKVLDKLPNGLNTILGKDVEPEGVELSGGEKQLVAISRAHMSNREIMIFDEPAAKLDPLAEMDQFINIKKELNNKTAILISHRMGFARLADKIIVMKDGKIIEQGSHKQLIMLNGYYSNMFSEQAMWYETVK